MLDELWRWRPGLVSEQQQQQKRSVWKHASALRCLTERTRDLNVVDECFHWMRMKFHKWNDALWARLAEWVRTPSSHLTACGQRQCSHVCMCLPWQRCRTYLNSSLAFFESRSVKWRSISEPWPKKKKKIPLVFSQLHVSWVSNGPSKRFFSRVHASALLRIGWRSRFCVCVPMCVCVCVWSWAGWVSRPSQMNRGWEEAWRGCRGWEARALPKKLLLWDLCTFAFLTKHQRAWLKRQSTQGGRRSRSPEVSSIVPLLLFKLYSFFPFTIAAMLLFSLSPSVLSLFSVSFLY